MVCNYDLLGKKVYDSITQFIHQNIVFILQSNAIGSPRCKRIKATIGLHNTLYNNYKLIYIRGITDRLDSTIQGFGLDLHKQIIDSMFTFTEETPGILLGISWVSHGHAY